MESTPMDRWQAFEAVCGYLRSGLLGHPRERRDSVSWELLRREHELMTGDRDAFGREHELMTRDRDAFRRQLELMTIDRDRLTNSKAWKLVSSLQKIRQLLPVPRPSP